MHDVALIAATEWARAHAPRIHDPVEFGHKVALVLRAARATQGNTGNEAATVAALAALSIPPEVLQAIALLSSLNPGRKVESLGTDSVGAES